MLRNSADSALLQKEGMAKVGVVEFETPFSKFWICHCYKGHSLVNSLQETERVALAIFHAKLQAFLKVVDHLGQPKVHELKLRLTCKMRMIKFCARIP